MKANLQPNWLPRWFKRMPKSWQRPKPTRPPAETNHQRVKAQRASRP